MIACATLEEPAEYLEWGVCQDCGATLDISDIPEDAEMEEGEPELKGTPSEFYD
jgi:hypothetical protein